MHKLEKQLIDKGIIDSDLTSFLISDWYSNIKISFVGNEDGKLVTCSFDDCFEIDFKHDLSYSKGKTTNGTNDFKYFIQDIKISEQDGNFHCFISAWPFQGKIICKSISIE